MIQSQRHLFRMPPEVAYLNCAYMSPLLRSVEKVGNEMVARKCLPYEIQVEDFFKPVRKLKENFARLINLDEPERLSVIPAVSYGMANVAGNLKPAAGDQIVVAADQFPSNYYPWQRMAETAGAEIVVVKAPHGGQRTADWNAAIQEAIGERTAMVALGPVHWADGTVFDLSAIRQKTESVGAWLVIDGTQAVGALPFDLTAIRPDALICAGYKWLMGPYSIGLAYYGPAFDEGAPIEENWINRRYSEDFKNLVHYRSEYQSVGARFSVGEQSNFILAPMLSRAIEQILEWRPERIQAYCRQIAARPLERLTAMGAKMEPGAVRAHHLFGIQLGEHIDLDRLKQAFAEEQVYVSFRGNAIRVAPHLYNDEGDFDRLVACFEKAWSKKAAG